MSEQEVMGTAATEAIRIAEKYLPRWDRQKELAMEIADAIGLCEAEMADEIARKLSALVAANG